VKSSSGENTSDSVFGHSGILTSGVLFLGASPLGSFCQRWAFQAAKARGRGLMGLWEKGTIAGVEGEKWKWESGRVGGVARWLSDGLSILLPPGVSAETLVG